MPEGLKLASGDTTHIFLDFFGFLKKFQKPLPPAPMTFPNKKRMLKNVGILRQIWLTQVP